MLGIGDLENQKRYDIKFTNKSGWSAQPYMGHLSLQDLKIIHQKREGGRKTVRAIGCPRLL